MPLQKNCFEMHPFCQLSLFLKEMRVPNTQPPSCQARAKPWSRNCSWLNHLRQNRLLLFLNKKSRYHFDSGF